MGSLRAESLNFTADWAPGETRTQLRCRDAIADPMQPREPVAWDCRSTLAVLDKRRGASRRSPSAFAEQDYSHGPEEDQQIEQQRVILDIVKIIFELLDGLLDIPAIGVAHLRPTG